QLKAFDCHIICGSRHAFFDTRDNVEWFEADLASAAQAQWLVRNASPNIIFHLTSESKGDQKIENVLPCFDNDLRTTVNCLVAAQEIGGCRFVMTGSLEEPILPLGRDDADPIPLSPYAAAKFAAGFYGKMFHHVYKLPVVVLRPFMTYG